MTKTDLKTRSSKMASYASSPESVRARRGVRFGIAVKPFSCGRSPAGIKEKGENLSSYNKDKASR